MVTMPFWLFSFVSKEYFFTKSALSSVILISSAKVNNLSEPFCASLAWSTEPCANSSTVFDTASIACTVSPVDSFIDCEYFKTSLEEIFNFSIIFLNSSLRWITALPIIPISSLYEFIWS